MEVLYFGPLSFNISFLCLLVLSLDVHFRVSLDVVFSDFMFLGDWSASTVVPELIRKRKRRCSFYFSSSRTLTRLRMKRGKKVVSKSSSVGFREVRKSIRFEGRASGDSIGAGGQNLLDVHEDIQSVSLDHEVVGPENVTIVSH